MVYTLKRSINLPISLDRAWEFFSDPRNLPLITPPSLDLRITSELPAEMHPGMIIQYSVVPVPPFRATWVSEITHLNAPHYFVDEQRVGPYSMWHHEHRFLQIGAEVEILDQVTYVVPGGPLAPIIHSLLVNPRLEQIFNYRTQKLTEMFSKGPSKEPTCQ